MADEKKSESERPTQIGIYYLRSRHYRTIHAEGAQVGITPRAHIQFTLFSEQKPMPEFVLHRITPTGTLGEVIEEAVKDGAIREVEVNVIMDVPTAVQFVDVLQTTLKQLEDLQKKQQTTAPPGNQKAGG